MSRHLSLVVGVRLVVCSSMPSPEVEAHDSVSVNHSKLQTSIAGSSTNLNRCQQSMSAVMNNSRKLNRALPLRARACLVDRDFKNPAENFWYKFVHACWCIASAERSANPLLPRGQACRQEIFTCSAGGESCC
jgi:hypothetical protein